MQSNTKNIAIIFLAASTLGLGVQLFHTRQQLADARKAPSLQVKRSDISVSAAPKPVVAPESAAPEASESAPENSAPPEGGPGPGNPGGRGNRGGFGQQMAELMKDPEFAAAVKVEQEARLDQRYGALFKQLNLAPAKLAELKAMLLERENAMRDVMTTAAAQGLNPRENRDELRRLSSEMQAEVDNNIKATFGDGVVNALSAYNSTTAQRATVNDLNQRLSYFAQPLNDTQSKLLTTILSETAQSSTQGGQWGRNNSVLITDATIARAQGVLMPSQVEVLKKLQAEQQAQQLVQTKMREAREKAQAARNAARQNRNNAD